ncbi:hypothetical protein GCK72_021401 [Caenorhabditis remanei]|uniref:F-box domain-containing protein n=1 Tax=Caenorhabditis remanei TaxID=31234 RepID=A0A6A5GJQ4_CAERE|nr:hypothetical protein GCK72_021401 [Caenorhabditis remanei]KAF1754836.1 hypothetical protein GCK72_021401 [Caenorhabditis remanei]
MNADVPLLKLPDVAMNRILRHCEYPDFARLRKTCHSLRGFLDTTRPDARMDKTYVNSSTFNRCMIRYNETISLSDTVGKFGVQPYESEWARSSRQWFFCIPYDNTKVLKLDVNNRTFIKYERDSAADVPYAAVLIN